MIEMLPIKEKQILDELNQKHNVKATYGYICLERKEITACCLYEIKDNAAHFLYVSDEDEYLFDGLVRASFVNIMNLDIDSAYFNENIDHNLLKKLNFVQDDTFFVKSLSEIIDKCKNCKNI